MWQKKSTPIILDYFHVGPLTAHSHSRYWCDRKPYHVWQPCGFFFNDVAIFFFLQFCLLVLIERLK